jgi:small nuclear ribonucleoprotein (snRNP)-like protein
MQRTEIARNVGRKVRVTLLDGSSREGVLVAADEDSRFVLRDEAARLARGIRYDSVGQIDILE